MSLGCIRRLHGTSTRTREGLDGACCCTARRSCSSVEVLRCLCPGGSRRGTGAIGACAASFVAIDHYRCACCWSWRIHKTTVLTMRVIVEVHNCAAHRDGATVALTVVGGATMAHQQDVAVDWLPRMMAPWHHGRWVAHWLVAPTKGQLAKSTKLLR